MKSWSFQLHAAGVLAPGLASLADLRLAARGQQPIAETPLVLPAPPQLPPAERRRASQAVRLTLACVAQALDSSPFDPAQLRSVFATDEGMRGAVNVRCLARAGEFAPQQTVSPQQLPPEERRERWRRLWTPVRIVTLA